MARQTVGLAQAPSSWAESFSDIVALSPAQKTALIQVSKHAQPVTIAVLAEELNLHQNSVRETLDLLLEAKLVDRSKLASSGRGRPSWGYFAVAPFDPTFATTQTALLISAFLEQIRAVSDDPVQAAQHVGEVWADKITAQADIPDHSAMTVDEQYFEHDFVIHVAKIRVFLTALGSSATISPKDPYCLELRSCPFLDADGTTDPLICEIHRGMLARLFDKNSQGHVYSELRPKCASGVCELVIRPKFSEDVKLELRT
ncbi:MAG: MarR family transcriptional regulator [Actinomycetaceae bacterium]|nr:MarR family transcriptional regulator [Actinomycetaceae bacterium]